MTDELPVHENEPPTTPGRRHLPRWAKVVAVAGTVVVLVGAGVGVGVAATSGSTNGTPTTQPTTTSPSTAPSTHAKAHGKKKAPDPARVAWAHKYGVDHATMPDLAPVASATSAQQSAATALLDATEAATSKYADLTVAKAAGFDLQKALTRAERRHPRLAKAIARIDAGTAPAHPLLLHVAHKPDRADHTVLDPNAPQALTYEYTGHGVWKLVGVVYSANAAYPAAPAVPGGPITRWQYHAAGQALTMPVFFAPDLAHAFAAKLG